MRGIALYAGTIISFSTTFVDGYGESWYVSRADCLHIGVCRILFLTTRLLDLLSSRLLRR